MVSACKLSCLRQGEDMWLSLLIIFSFCFFFWLARRATSKTKEVAEETDDRDMGPLAALYYCGFWEDD